MTFYFEVTIDGVLGLDGDSNFIFYGKNQQLQNVILIHKVNRGFCAKLGNKGYFFVFNLNVSSRIYEI